MPRGRALVVLASAVLLAGNIVRTTVMSSTADSTVGGEVAQRATMAGGAVAAPNRDGGIFGLPIIGHSPSPSVGSPTPTPSQSGGASITLDLAHLGAPINPAVVGVDQYGTTEQGIWNASPTGSTTPLLYSSAATQASSMHLGLVRMEPYVNVDSGCTPNQYSGDCGQYRWQDHVGPTANRAYQSPTMGPDDYMAMLHQSAPGATPFVVANMETATVQDIANEVAYMNGTTGAMAGQRAANAAGAGPYNVVYWELGNEEFDHVAALRNELGDAARNPNNCPDYTQSGYTDYNAGQLYGCLLAGYASAMRAAENSSGGSVSLQIVADTAGSSDWLQGMEATAGGAFDDVDYHDYSAEADPSNVVFDRDGQWTTFSVSPVTGTTAQRVTYAFWVTGSDAQGPPMLQAKLDDSPMVLQQNCGGGDCTSSRVTIGNYSPMPQLLVASMSTSPGWHKLSITACAPTPLGPAISCPKPGGGSGSSNLVVNLRHVSTALGQQSTTQMLGYRSGLLPLSCISWRPDPDSTISGVVATSQWGSSTQPWRLSGSDFALASTADMAPRTRLTMGDLRTILNSRPGTGIFIGEHAMFGGCDESPLYMTESQTAGLTAVERIIGYISAGSPASSPMLGAAFYQLNSYLPNTPYCAGFALLREVGCLTANRPDAAYLSAPGQDMALAGALSTAAGGVGVPISINSATVSVGRIVDQAPASGIPAVAGVAYHYSDGSTRVLLVNALPATALAETIGGAAFTSASATTVAASPMSANFDGNQTVVAPQILSTSISGGQAALTLPAFSCTLVVLH